jgi:hypothetical protein
MTARYAILLVVVAATLTCAALPAGEEELFLGPLNVNPPHFSKDRSVKLDYDLVYVRAERHGDGAFHLWAEAAHPVVTDPGADLMLLHPDGREEVLVPGGDGAVADPYVSFDGEWVYYAKFHNLKDLTPTRVPRHGADIYKIHVKTRKIVQLTEQTFTPNTGATRWSSDYRTPQPGRSHLTYGVFNLGPCPLPGGKVMFTSNRNAFRPARGLTSPITLQLFVMDDDGGNVEQIGYLNLSTVLHPTILRDGRVMFSTLESQGIRDIRMWGIWTIHPDGTNWGPLVSAFKDAKVFHFQTQLSDGRIVIEEYYNQNNEGFGTYFTMPEQPPADDYPAFGPGDMNSNAWWRVGRYHNGRPVYTSMPFSPTGVESLTRFISAEDDPAGPSVLGQPDSPRVGKFTHPSGAPDNHLLTVWSPGPAKRMQPPAPDGGLYLIKAGKPIDEPGQMLLIKNDPNYNEQWPRALVPYERIYGVKEPRRLPPFLNDGKLSPHLPEGTPFGLVGTSSMYKRESYPNGFVPKGQVTATFSGKHDRTGGFRDLDPFNTTTNDPSLNWLMQGADAGVYSNDDVHAIRIVVMDPTTDTGRDNQFANYPNERLRILGEIPVRKFDGDRQPTDPDGHPDTSFLAKIPADVAFTFQTLDKHGMVLNMAQTWHQLRPGEIRHNCGGCHAHSQQPTEFKDTWAARPDYAIFDLTRRTPLLTTKVNDESFKKWDAHYETGLRYEPGVKHVEFNRDVRPILERSCVACHTHKAAQPPGNLVLDDDGTTSAYDRLAWDPEARFGYRPLVEVGGKPVWRAPNASRYIRMLQARRSLLIWKVFGRRTDGWSNDDFPTETVPGDASTLQQKGQPVPDTKENRNRADLDFTGSIMPPPEAVAGTYVGPDGKKIKVAPLSDEDRLTLVRWVDLGCPIDAAYDPARPRARGGGWMLDDHRPTLTLTCPRTGANDALTRILVGMHDYYTGLDLKSFQVVADFAVDGVPANRNLAARFKPTTPGVWELKLSRPITRLPKGKVTVSVRDQEGNLSRIERTFSVGTSAQR